MIVLKFIVGLILILNFNTILIELLQKKGQVRNSSIRLSFLFDECYKLQQIYKTFNKWYGFELQYISANKSKVLRYLPEFDSCLLLSLPFSYFLSNFQQWNSSLH